MLLQNKFYSIGPRSRISASNGLDSLNNSRVVNRFAGTKKNVNSERERLGVVSTSAASFLEQDEEDQDTVSDRGKFKRRTESMTSTRSLYNRFEYKLPS